MDQEQGAPSQRGPNWEAYLTTAAQVLAVKGYHGTPTREVATALGMTVAGMYFHFASKENLLFSISSHAHSQLLALLRARVEAQVEPRGQLQGLVGAMVEYHTDNIAFARVANFDLDPLTDDHRATIVQMRRELQELVATVVQSGVDQGVFFCDQAEVVAVAIFSLCVDVSRWYRPGHSWSPTTIAELYGQLALRMVVADPAAGQLSR